MSDRTSALLLRVLEDAGFEFSLVPSQRLPLGVRMKVPEDCGQRQCEAVKALVSDERFRLAALLAERDVPEAPEDASTYLEGAGPGEPTGKPGRPGEDPDAGVGTGRGA